MTATATGRYAGLRLSQPLDRIIATIRRIADEEATLDALSHDALMDLLLVLQRRLWAVSPGHVEHISYCIGALDTCPGSRHYIDREIIFSACSTFSTITPDIEP